MVVMGIVRLKLSEGKEICVCVLLEKNGQFQALLRPRQPISDIIKKVLISNQYAVQDLVEDVNTYVLGTATNECRTAINTSRGRIDANLPKIRPFF